jgi:hypothetical protein
VVLEDLLEMLEALTRVVLKPRVPVEERLVEDDVAALDVGRGLAHHHQLLALSAILGVRGGDGVGVVHTVDVVLAVVLGEGDLGLHVARFSWWGF